MLINDKYALGEEIGRGAAGQVFKGSNIKTGELVAIKRIPLHGIKPDELQATMHEIEILKKLQHKNIVDYIGSYKTKQYLFIVMDFMEHGAIGSLIKPNRFGAFPEPLAAVYTAQVLQGLGYLHG